LKQQQGVNGVDIGSGNEPLIKTTGTIADSAVIDLGGLVATHSDFHITLHKGNSLGDVVGEFVTDTSDVSDVLGQLGHTDSLTEDLDTVRQFDTVLSTTIVREVGRTRVGIDIRTVNDGGRSCGSGETVGLPAEDGVTGLCALLRHRREGSVLRIDESDEVSQVFTLTSVDDVFFEKFCHCILWGRGREGFR